jgi:hypothetical protein
MPVKIKKLKNNRFQVATPNMVHAKSATLENAMAQKRLINAVEHGWKPTGKPRVKHGGKRVARPI